MTATTQSADFLKTLSENYGGQARVEVDTGLSEVRFEGARPTYVRILIKVFLGRPVGVGGELVSPVEIPGLATFDVGRDGKMSWGEVCQFVLRRALDMAYPGASSLVDKDSDALLTADRMRLLLTGANEGLLLFEVKMLGDRS